MSLRGEQSERYDVFGKEFVFTGRLMHFTRDQASALIRERGGRFATTVSSRTDYLIYGDGPVGGKHRRADQLRVNKRSEQWFMAAMMSSAPGLVPRNVIPVVMKELMVRGYNDVKTRQELEVGVKKTRRVRVE